MLLEHFSHYNPDLRLYRKKQSILSLNKGVYSEPAVHNKPIKAANRLKSTTYVHKYGSPCPEPT